MSHCTISGIIVSTILISSIRVLAISSNGYFDTKHIQNFFSFAKSRCRELNSGVIYLPQRWRFHMAKQAKGHWRSSYTFVCLGEKQFFKNVLC